LEAFQAFFAGMPADSGMAFVLVQHLDPRHETLMPELLARHTPMPVLLVPDETKVEENHVYVIPPNATLTIDDCTLRVTRPERSRGRRTPIDSFFRSLAEDQGDDAVAVVLSGTGTDGALGVKAVKEHGGLTLVQAPASAHYDSMPRAAILTGMADDVLPVQEMPARLMRHLGSLAELRGGGAHGLREELGDQLVKICSLLRRKTGHDFSRYKRSTLVRRIRRRMAELRGDSVTAYVERLRDDPKEVDQLFRDLLIGVTNFFRDPDAFQLLAHKVIPRMFDKKGIDGQVRVWVPGCATGEEAYSLAILLREQALLLDEPPHVQLFATDIDAHALEAARQGWYPERIAEQVSEERLARFFVRHGNMLQVAKEIREMCLFSTHNLITDPPFSRLDLMSCRNLLIYLEADLQKKLVPLCHYALRSGGYLFLGPSESVTSWPELFRTVDRRHRIFQSKDVVLRPPVSFPLAERTRYPHSRLVSEEPPAPQSGGQNVARAFERILLDHYSPACVLINERGDIAYFSPRTGRYLEAPAGTPTLNVFDMARQGLRLDLRTAIHKAMTSRAPVTHENVSFELEGRTQRVSLSVRPMFELGGDDPGLYMVVFQEIAGAELAEPGTEAGEDGASRAVRPDAADGIIQRLEAELRSTKDHLQATLEELESSNEELVSSNEELLSINEELQSANEELQTSKEELQSVNEELETINAELKKKIDELDRLNSDLLNLFQSTQIATIFVDRDLRIKKFTPAATEVFRLIESDAGRLIADIAPRFVVSGDLLADVRSVLRTLAVKERQVRLVDEEAWYILRILPYRTVDNVIDGVVMTFVDITDRKLWEETLDQAAQRKDEFLAMLGHELRNPLAPIRNCLQVLAMPNASEAQVERARATIERQVHHLTRLVDDLLDVSRISQGKILLRKEHLDLVALVRSTLEDHRGALVAAGLDLDVSLPEQPLWVSGDPTRLAQAVGNVLHNAGKFTDRGGRVAVLLGKEGSEAVLAVRDTGIGIEPEVLTQLFEPFSQAPPGLDRSRGGLGLGLALVRRLVALHGGLVEAASEGLGRGAEVRLRLPLDESQPAAAPAPAAPAERRARRCLIIEDNLDAAESMALLLQLEGHAVELAADGAQGIARARQARPDIVMCDIGLPGGLDGYAVARALRADPQLAGTFLVALTGYGQVEDQRRAREAGFDVHLTKPADFAVLRRIIADLADRPERE
jgi:two-component system CheB/CheR fusion protein